ncbi:MAG: ATP-dependent zinc metalloprotease FtsH [Candidatus Andersenbacteria bacterium]|nr:ATP-dependent zinc metalloprotease FtsH [bacterium]MDZ4225512.1 ATP-dependent zinc metalloprotease FtsH [Candidatus Andersenbacteria bacterium]
MPKPTLPSFRRDGFLKNIGIALLILLVVLSIVGIYGRPLQTTEDVSITRIVDEIQANNVDSITVKQDEVDVKIKNSDTELITQKETDASITDTLHNLGITDNQLKNLNLTFERPSGLSYWMNSLLPILLPFLLLGGFLWFMMRSAQSASNRAMTFGQTTQRPVEQKDGKKRVTFKDVAGNLEAKHELEEVVEFLKTPKKFLRLGARIPKGVLLIGPPGTGKTLIARAVAGETGVPFFSISGSDFVEMFVGVGASRVRDLFRKVKHRSPAILFIDELDAVGRQRGTGLGGGHDEREQTLNQILVEMDGFEQNDNVIVLAATNRPDVLDPALLRPGRFDRQVTMELPDIREREEIMKIHSRHVPLADDSNLRNIAERTPGFSGADLANLINEAAIFAARHNRNQVLQSDMTESIEKVMLGPERRSRVFSDHEKKVTAYHEAGHAVVAYYMPHTDPVRKISIISRGHAGGYTLKLPEQDRHLHTKTEFIGELATLMGGFTAEQKTFQDITTGASNDLSKATALARRIVTEWGMSDLGPITFGHKDEFVFLGRDLHESRNYSEDTATKIDAAISKFISQACDQAAEILNKYSEKLELIAQTLIKQETIEQVEFAELMSGQPAVSPVSDDSNQSPPGEKTASPAVSTQPSGAAA